MCSTSYIGMTTNDVSNPAGFKENDDSCRQRVLSDPISSIIHPIMYTLQWVARGKYDGGCPSYRGHLWGWEMFGVTQVVMINDSSKKSWGF